jgi:peptidoglycan/xylan/chitin deacetylase (PgdA/CDA1 family)
MKPTPRIPVLMYHRVGAAHNEWERKYCVSPRQFSAHMNALASKGWCAITLGDFFTWLDNGIELPEKSFLLTFDDGFHGVYEYAAPVLRALNWPATVFLVSTLIGKRDSWCEAHNPSGVTYPLMDSTQILELRGQGFDFQSHTRSHADLPTLNDESLQDELAGSREDLQNLLGEPVSYLAYPFGRYDERVLSAAQRAGYRAAFSTQPGFNRREIERFRIRRLDVFGTDSSSALLNKIRLGSNDGSFGNGVRYRVNRLLTRFGLRSN